MFSVILKGHNFEYEVGELLKAFGILDFSFVLKDFGDVDNYNHHSFLINELKGNDTKYIVRTKIIEDGSIVGSKQAEYNLNYIKGNIEKRKEIKRLIKLNIYDTLVKADYESLPWGILTGIRPAKIVHEMLDRNFTIDDIKDILKTRYRLSDDKIQLVMGIAMREREYIYPIKKDLISLYISIPFCPTRCIYCSFPSNPIKSKGNKVDDYLNSLHKEIVETGKLIRDLGKKVENIYIGGGTPTTLSSEQLRYLIAKIFDSFDTTQLKEFTVEAGRPDTIDEDKLIVLKNNGVDRISINPQTMNKNTLKTIGRIHTVEDIERTYYKAREIGFRTINMDIIIGLPNEGINEINHTLEKIEKLSPENLTVHTLAIKKSSELKQSIDEYRIKEDLVVDMLKLARRYSEKMGLFPYYMYRQKYMVGNLENTGYCKVGHECIYNMQIMEEKQTIIALGAGGVSKIVYPRENRLERVPNVKNVDEYINRVDEMIDRKKLQLCRT